MRAVVAKIFTFGALYALSVSVGFADPIKRPLKFFDSLDAEAISFSIEEGRPRHLLVKSGDKTILEVREQLFGYHINHLTIDQLLNIWTVKQSFAISAKETLGVSNLFTKRVITPAEALENFGTLYSHSDCRRNGSIACTGWIDHTILAHPSEVEVHRGFECDEYYITVSGREVFRRESILRRANSEIAWLEKVVAETPENMLLGITLDARRLLSPIGDAIKFAYVPYEPEVVVEVLPKPVVTGTPTPVVDVMPAVKTDDGEIISVLKKK